MKWISAAFVSWVTVCTALCGAGCSGMSTAPIPTPTDTDDASGSSSGSGSASSGGSSGGGSSGGSTSSGGSASSGSSGGSGSSSGAGTDAGTCSTSGDCSSGQICGFLESAGCSAVGSCFESPGVTCNAIALACACDGTNINIACNGLPGGYAPKPYAHEGMCGLDSGAVDAGPKDASSLGDGAACVASGGDPCGAGLACCPTAGYSGAPTACTPICTGTGCAGSCRALP